MKNDAGQQKGVFRQKPTARFNPDATWPDGYFEVLAEAGVPERQRSFHAHWVRQFFHCHPGRARRTLGLVEIRRFLQALKNDPGMALWQVEQAKTALVLYYEKWGTRTSWVRTRKIVDHQRKKQSKPTMKSEKKVKRQHPRRPIRVPQPA